MPYSNLNHSRPVGTENRPYVSIIVPLYNEEESVPLLHERICEALNPVDVPYEIIFVDDGSSDNTLSVASGLAQQDPNLHVVELRKNYGQTPAMAAGIDLARGEFLVTMDGDLQNDPSDIPMMLEKIQEGYDIVVGWRFNRQDKLVSRKIPSKIANKLIAKVTGVDIKDNGCSLKVYRAELMQNVPFYNEMHRFIPALLSVSGSKFAEVKVKHHARQFGESKYGLSRIYKVLLDLLTIKTISSITAHPVVWFAKIASIPFIFSLIFFLQTFVQLSHGEPVLAVATVAIMFSSLSVFLIGLGFLGESIYHHGAIQVSKLASLTIRANKDANKKKMPNKELNKEAE